MDIPRVTVTDHRVQCVDGLVCQSQRGTSNREIYERSDDTVGSALRNGFHRRTHNFRLGHGFGITPHDLCNRLPCTRQIPARQLLAHYADMIPQIAPGQRRERQPRPDCLTKQTRFATSFVDKQSPEPVGRGWNQDRKSESSYAKTPLRAAYRSDTFITPGNDVSHKPNGVGKPAWIS